MTAQELGKHLGKTVLVNVPDFKRYEGTLVMANITYDVCEVKTTDETGKEFWHQVRAKYVKLK
jgi:hypothetical protein